MLLRTLREFFTPVNLDSEPGFRAEVEQHWRRGLLIIAGVEVGIPVLIAAVRAVFPAAAQAHVPPWTSLGMFGIGAVAFAATRLPRQFVVAAASFTGL